jgi:hypothetical protein
VRYKVSIDAMNRSTALPQRTNTRRISHWHGYSFDKRKSLVPPCEESQTCERLILEISYLIGHAVNSS